MYHSLNIDEQFISLQYQTPVRMSMKLIADPEYIKKCKLVYQSCRAQGLHEGEKLTLVCVDSKCTSKGLICPVCKEKSHQGHNVMHVKIFLSELHSSINSASSNADNLAEKNQEIRKNALTENLLQLETARKQVRKSLQDLVKSLANKFKEVEEKLNQNYLKVRKAILCKGSLENKLPAIYKMLIPVDGQEQQYSQKEIQDEIRKCADLMQSKNNKHTIIDDAKNIVDGYSKQTDACLIHLMGVVTDLTDKFKNIPLGLKSLVDVGVKSGASSQQYKFSQSLKADNLQVEDEGKSIRVREERQKPGYAFIDGNEGQGARKVCLKITGSTSDSISLGVGRANSMKQFGFMSNYGEAGEMIGICAMGISIVDMESPSFVFSQGDVIELVLEEETATLTISRRNGVEKEEMELEMSPAEAKELQFFVCLPVMGDSVEIVE